MIFNIVAGPDQHRKLNSSHTLIPCDHREVAQ
jgi:hypothetical protein